MVFPPHSPAAVKGRWPDPLAPPRHERLTWEGFLLPKQSTVTDRDALRIEAQRLRDELCWTPIDIANRLQVPLATVRHWLSVAKLGRSVLRRGQLPVGPRDELLDRYFLTPIGSEAAHQLLHAVRFSPVSGTLPEFNDDD